MSMRGIRNKYRIIISIEECEMESAFEDRRCDQTIVLVESRAAMLRPHPLP